MKQPVNNYGIKDKNGNYLSKKSALDHLKKFKITKEELRSLNAAIKKGEIESYYDNPWLITDSNHVIVNYITALRIIKVYESEGVKYVTINQANNTLDIPF